MSGPTMATREWLLLIILSIIWGGSFFFAEIALRELEPLTIVFGRVSIAALALLIFVRLSGKSMPWDIKSWRQFFIMGGLNNMIPFSLIVWGQSQFVISTAETISGVALDSSMIRCLTASPISFLLATTVWTSVLLPMISRGID